MASGAGAEVGRGREGLLSQTEIESNTMTNVSYQLGSVADLNL